MIWRGRRRPVGDGGGGACRWGRGDEGSRRSSGEGGAAHWRGACGGADGAGRHPAASADGTGRCGWLGCGRKHRSAARVDAGGFPRVVRARVQPLPAVTHG